METNPTIELSDDENVPANGNDNRTRNDGNKMPPPAFVPPVKATKEKKAPVEKKIRSTRSKQPKRKVILNCLLESHIFDMFQFWNFQLFTNFRINGRSNKSRRPKVKTKRHQLKKLLPVNLLGKLLALTVNPNRPDRLEMRLKNPKIVRSIRVANHCMKTLYRSQKIKLHPM